MPPPALFDPASMKGFDDFAARAAVGSAVIDRKLDVAAVVVVDGDGGGRGADDAVDGTFAIATIAASDASCARRTAAAANVPEVMSARSREKIGSSDFIAPAAAARSDAHSSADARCFSFRSTMCLEAKAFISLSLRVSSSTLIFNSSGDSITDADDASDAREGARGGSNSTDDA